MTEIEAILQYQEVDGKLRTIEAEIAGSEERKKFFTAKRFLEKASDKLDAFDGKAVDLRRAAEQLTKKYIELAASLNEFSNLDELIAEGADVSFYKKSAAAVTESLKGIKAELAALTTAINSTQREYNNLKQQTLNAQKQFKEYKVKYGEVKDARAAEIAAIEKQLKALEPNVGATIMEKYKAKRKEHIFPIVGELQNDRCPFCGMDLPIASQSKLSDGHPIECENCHRFIYKK